MGNFTHYIELSNESQMSKDLLNQEAEGWALFGGECGLSVMVPVSDKCTSGGMHTHTCTHVHTHVHMHAHSPEQIQQANILSITFLLLTS